MRDTGSDETAHLLLGSPANARRLRAAEANLEAGGALADGETYVRAAKAISHAPFGVRSARALARLIGSSDASATKALDTLQARGLVTKRSRTVAAGRAVEVTEWVAHDLAMWPSELLADIKATTLPQLSVGGDATGVPPRFHHLFGEANVGSLKLPDDAAFVAARLLTSPDPVAIGWALTELPADALEQTVSSRSFPAADLWLLEVAWARGASEAIGPTVPEGATWPELSAVASDTKAVADLFVSKLEVFADRHEPRDALELMLLEQSTMLEQGLTMYVARHRPASPEAAVWAIVRALGSLEGPGLPVERYWHRRAIDVMRWFGALASCEA